MFYPPLKRLLYRLRYAKYMNYGSFNLEARRFIKYFEWCLILRTGNYFVRQAKSTHDLFQLKSNGVKQFQIMYSFSITLNVMRKNMDLHKMNYMLSLRQ